MNVDCIGKVNSIQMQCIAELSRRMARSEHRSGVTFCNPKSIADYYMERTRYLCKEQVYVLMFDSSHHLLKECRLSEGTVDHAVVSPRDIFIDALKYQAVYIVLLHNHPSGNLLTKRAYEARKTPWIRLSYHIILGNNCFVSLAERGIIE